MIEVKVIWGEEFCASIHGRSECWNGSCDDCDNSKCREKQFMGNVESIEFQAIPLNYDGDIRYELKIKVNKRKKIGVKVYRAGSSDYIKFLEINGNVVIKDYEYVEDKNDSKL